LATILGATDAALGKAVVSNPIVPGRLRESLNIESGLNDGLCVPILFVFIALAEGGGEGRITAMALELVAEELGIGLIVGLTVTFIGASLFRLCNNQGWVTEIWQQTIVLSLALSCFFIAQTLHGSGYIAAFSGGLLFGFLAQKETHKLILATEGISEILALLTWMLFGSVVIGIALGTFSWLIVFYSILSLTIVRIIPIVLSLTGTGENVPSKIFLGWFGPRGLASIVFAVIVLEKNLPGGELIAMTVICTVFISLVVHGVSAVPLAKWIGRKGS
jgi:NhaP-type Na+/H+ or K+/H+ antiporter